MITIKIPYKSPSSYFWYFYRCIQWLEKTNVARVEYFRPEIKESYVMQFYFNNQLIWIDVRDNNRLSPTYKDTDGIIFKSNYSSELWDNPPQNFPFINQEWEHKLRKQIRPFILGRAFGEPYRSDEFAEFTKDQIEPIHNIFSFSGTGLTNQLSLNRLKIYELLDIVPQTNLIFWLRVHGEAINAEAKQRASKFQCSTTATDLKLYYNQLKQAKYSLNVPGICASQPFRCIDAVINNRAIISTKIWCDIYKTFPCIELPVCGYFGNGNWEQAKDILINLDSYNYQELAEKARHWYSWYLSPEGMWRNQILKQLC